MKKTLLITIDSYPESTFQFTTVLSILKDAITGMKDIKSIFIEEK